MDIVVMLALKAGNLLAEAHEGHEAGFGLNFDLLETNLINLIIIIAVLVYFGRGFLGKVLKERQLTIESAIQDAERRKQEASVALAEQQQKLAQAQTEASRIIAEAKESAEAAKAMILAKAEQDVQRMKAAASQDLDSQQERVIRELRQRAVMMAVQQAEVSLKSDLNEDTKRHLIDRSVAMLGGGS
jgi:F-type H+-transporting ATPase subunit b